jgi:hypothetical protein
MPAAGVIARLLSLVVVLGSETASLGQSLRIGMGFMAAWE